MSYHGRNSLHAYIQVLHCNSHGSEYMSVLYVKLPSDTEYLLFWSCIYLT